MNARAHDAYTTRNLEILVNIKIFIFQTLGKYGNLENKLAEIYIYIVYI